MRAGAGRWILIALVAGGCTERPRGLDLDVEFASSVDGSSAAAIRARILRGGCGGTEAFTTTFRAGEPGRTPEALPPGRWGFEAVAFDGSCEAFASGCRQVDLPLPDAASITVTLVSSALGAACPVEACDDGLCTGACAIEVRVEGVCEDDDCDGMAEEGFVDFTSPDHCGDGCNRCPEPEESRRNSVRVCVDGGCGFECTPGTMDCDGDPENGCEELNTNAHCGACGTSCTAPELCVGARCDTQCGSLTACLDGCFDVAVDPRHCGDCDKDCDLDHVLDDGCVAGECAIELCEDGYADCNGDASDGCETSLGGTANCMACGNDCSAAPAVTSAFCGLFGCRITGCEPGFQDCDGDPANGCEGRLDNEPNDNPGGVSYCSACGMVCDPVTEECSGSGCLRRPADP